MFDPVRICAILLEEEEDKRVAYAHLTSQGWRLIKRVAPHHVETVRAMMIDLLSPSEIKALGIAFEKISSHLRKCV